MKTLSRADQAESDLAALRDALAEERARRETAEADLAALSAATGGWLWRIDGRGGLLGATGGLARLVGAHDGALAGRPLVEVLRAHADGSAGRAAVEALAQALDAGAAFDAIVAPLACADGAVRRIALSGGPAAGGMAGHACDVTALHDARTDADRAVKDFREGVEAMAAGFALFQPDGRLSLCNRAYREMMAPLGLCPDRDAVTFELIVRRAAALSTYGEIGRGRPIEEVVAARMARFNAADGRPTEHCTITGRWYEMIERRTADGCVVCTRTEITALKRAEQRLAEAFRRAPVGLAMFDADDRIVMWNQRYVDAYPEMWPAVRQGVRFEDLCRLSGARLSSQSEASPTEDWVAARRALRADPGAPFTLITPSGRSIMVTESRMSDGGVLAVHADVTAMALLQEQVVHAQRRAEAALDMRSRFLADVSHELRTPLNAVMGYAELIARQTKGPLDPAYVAHAENIKQAGSFLLSLIVDILDMARLEAGRMPVHCAAIDPAPAIAAAVALLAPMAEARGLRLETRLDPPPPAIWAERRRLVQIVQNLLTNAVKFTDAGGVTVRTAVAGPLLRVIVEDTGRGMTEAEIETALTPFSQCAVFEAGDHVGGSGLGLPLVRAMVELQGGALTIESRPGVGTRVVAALPLARAEG